MGEITIENVIVMYLDGEEPYVIRWDVPLDEEVQLVIRQAVIRARTSAEQQSPPRKDGP